MSTWCAWCGSGTYLREPSIRSLLLLVIRHISKQWFVSSMVLWDQVATVSYFKNLVFEKFGAVYTRETKYNYKEEL